MSAVFCADYGFLCGGFRVVRRDVLYIHHPLSLVGCGYQLWRGIGGGLMVHLLLDGLDGLCSTIGDVLGIDTPKMAIVGSVASFLMRIIWYPFVSVRALLWIYAHTKELDVAWQLMVLIWCLIANTIHFVLLVQTIRENLFPKHKTTKGD